MSNTTDKTTAPLSGLNYLEQSTSVLNNLDIFEVCLESELSRDQLHLFFEQLKEDITQLLTP